MKSLHYNTVQPLLKDCLHAFMKSKEFRDFRLVGGTALSLQLGHRISVDIDLFTDAEYGSIDFEKIEDYLKAQFSYVDSASYGEPGMGRAYFVGTSSENCIKLDVFYANEAFLHPVVLNDGIRMAHEEDIIAMKLDVILRGGRKKDFWDLHELLERYSLLQMMAMHEKRYPYQHHREQLRQNLVNFAEADDDFEPQCLRNKYWELVKLDFIEAVSALP